MNTYAQRGEDLELEKIFDKLGISKGFFVDVGAWNGKYLSNTYWAVLKGWNGLEIEGNQKYANKAISILPSNIHVFCKYIGPDELDNILSLFNVPEDFDLLSIDIDTYDYWVWKNLEKFKPKVVIIEVNGLEDIEYVQPPVVGFKGKAGSSKNSTIKLAEEKGYQFYMDIGNLIFIRKDLYDLP